MGFPAAALLCALCCGLLAPAARAGYSEERCSWRGRPRRTRTSAAAWPPSALSCARTGAPSCPRRPTVSA
ncbi:meteorin, glial cell differentiation regulator [Homo sapiens]|uniref:Meteorin, glial cell differentiation regulator n=1 Tax=Homo sapiens TaxID=9606 RepID=H3BSC8_HUMAN|nr:meteorin, glial cell differentiation regulator [Homo sapiens]KAI4052642.1 meteorin, glial cell differentiation regulator [Homo sapiens]